MKLKIGIVSALLLATMVARGVDYTPKYELINNPAYPSTDLAVATFNVLDYGVDPTGSKDCTTAVQNILDAAAGVGTMTSVHNDSKKRGWYGNPTGGIVYFPAGTYLFSSSLHIPRGVTIRGDWKNPGKGSRIEGTVFKVDPTRGAGTEIESNSFIIMQPTTEVNGITFWYPKQDPSAIKKYSPTILYGENGYWGNDYCTVKHCTFVNSYTAIQFNSQNGGGCPDVFDIYGTPLAKGVVMDCIADVGRFDGLHFSADYWTKSGLDGAPSEGQISDWLYENATGFIMRRNDWSYTCNFDVEGYNVGFHSQPSPAGVSKEGNPNGHNYNFNLNGCKTGIKVSGASASGIMFTKIATPGCGVGIEMPEAVIGHIQVYGSDIYGRSCAVLLGDAASPGLMMQQCNVVGQTIIANGQFSCVNSKFTGDVNIGPKARTIFVGNRFSGGGRLINESLYECQVDDNAVAIADIPVFAQEWMEIKSTKPAREALYVVTDPRFGATGVTLFDDLSSAKDNTSAIQSALDLAKAEGGGIVYIPTGHYRIDGALTIPSGVELKGSGDLMSVPKANGAVLESYHGEGDENAAPFITMEKGSGLRGLTINYPNQNSPVAVKKYPYAVRGNADVYICNLAIRAAYRGVDLFTNKCDNHYVDYLSGHAFMNVIRVGGGSENGTISNIQCNTIAYACGDESKFGCWPNCDVMKDDLMSRKAYGQNSENLEFMIIGDSRGEILYNNFLFGCNKGMVFRNDGKGGAYDVHSLGNAVDGAVETFVFEDSPEDINLINSQVVAINFDSPEEFVNTDGLRATFIVTGKNFKKSATFFSGNFWGGGDNLVKTSGGNINFYSANLERSGAARTILTDNGGKVSMVNVFRNKGDKLFDVAGQSEKYCGVQASFINCNNANERLFAKWDNNLPLSWEFSDTDILLPRQGWKATASNDVNGTRIARNAIDGNASTRWSTEGSQSSGQWFEVDFGKTLELNTAIFDTSASPNDGPQAYKLEVFDPATNAWRKVAEGGKGGSSMIVTFETCNATKIRMTQTGSASGYWSIHEFNVANLLLSGIDDVISNNATQESKGISLIGNTLYVDETLVSDDTNVIVYNLDGRMISNQKVISTSTELVGLNEGLYVIAVTNPKVGIRTFKVMR